MPGPASVRWTWVDWVYCLFVIPVLVGLLLWWAARDWFEGLWIFALPAFLLATLGLGVAAGVGFRFLRCSWPQPRPMPWWQWPLWALPPLLVAAWIWIERHDERPGRWIDRTLWTPPFFFEIDLALTFDGEPVRLHRRIECVRYDVGSHNEGPRGIQSYATPRSVGQRLASGGAIMLVVPDVCGELARQAQTVPVPELTMGDDDLPLIAWTPTPDDPEMIEVYAARSYYQRPDARVRFHDLAIRRTAPGYDGPSQHEFAWFRPVDRETPPWKYPPRSYFGLYVVSAEEAKWSRAEPVARLLRNLERPAVVDWGELRTSLRTIHELPRPFGFWWTREFLRPQVYGGHPETGANTGYVEDFIPLRRSGDAYAPAPEERGVVVLYREPRWAQKGGEPLQIRLGGALLTIDQPFGSLGPSLRDVHVFDPRDRRLYALGAVYVHTLPPRR
jgi:hypothetical protein